MSDSALLNQIINLRNNCCFVGAKPSTFMRSLEKLSPLLILFGGESTALTGGALFILFFFYSFLKCPMSGRKRDSGV